jgi:hypothetical protein
LTKQLGTLALDPALLVPGIDLFSAHAAPGITGFVEPIEVNNPPKGRTFFLHILNSGLAVRAGSAGRKLVKSPSITIARFLTGVKQEKIMAEAPVISTKPHPNAGKPFMHGTGAAVSKGGGKKAC